MCKAVHFPLSDVFSLRVRRRIPCARAHAARLGRARRLPQPLPGLKEEGPVE